MGGPEGSFCYFPEGNFYKITFRDAGMGDYEVFFPENEVSEIEYVDVYRPVLIALAGLLTPHPALYPLGLVEKPPRSCRRRYILRQAYAVEHALIEEFG